VEANTGSALATELFHSLGPAGTTWLRLTFAAVLLLLGVVERLRHRRRLAAIPLRVNVNGSRGKSTVTRLLVGILAASGRRAVGKTTGTTARVIRSFDETEVPGIETFLAGRGASLFSLPEAQSAVLRIAEVSAGTPVVILYGVSPQ
jgi:hypothetical protein